MPYYDAYFIQHDPVLFYHARHHVLGDVEFLSCGYKRFNGVKYKGVFQQRHQRFRAFGLHPRSQAPGKYDRADFPDFF